MSLKTLSEENTAEISRPDESVRIGEELEEYDCGCKINFRKVDYGESKHELPRKALVVPEYIPCDKHKTVQTIPPKESRLVKVRREYESFLNE